MEENSFQENFKHVKDIILDEERCVTYISISKEMCIHVNEAKLLLSEVVKVLKQDYPHIKLNVNYIISGVSDVNQGQLTICSEKELEKLRETLKVVFYIHVYSVNKGSNLFDKVAFTSLNTFEDIPLCKGLIKGDFCSKRTPDEIGTLKSNSQEIVSSNNIQIVHKPQKDATLVKSAIKTEPQNVNDAVKAPEFKKVIDNNIKQEISIPTNKIPNSTKTVEKKPVNKTSKGIIGYFNKGNSVSTTKVAKETIKEKEVEIKVEKDEVLNVESEIVKESFVNETKSKKPKNQIKLNAKVDKKRKRVLRVSDSESDNENDPFMEKMAVDNESDDEIPPTPTINTVKITSGIINPKKRRKVVDKTYTDEEGYILTKKEEVYESCSDNEEEKSKEENKTVNKLENNIVVSPKGKNTKVAAKKKISPPQKGKQATMTNFFKKV